MTAKGYVDVRYLNEVADVLEHVKRQTYQAMHITAGDTVLDLGCGPGTDTIPLAALVGSTGTVCGVDYDPKMIQEAQARAEERHLGSQVMHYQARAHQLPFAADTFAACRSERLFQHLLQPALALAEMVRVTRNEGYIVLLDMDWGSFSIDTTRTTVERVLSTLIAQELHHNGYAGRQLYGLQQAHPQLTDIHLEIVPIFLTDYQQVCAVTPLIEAENFALARGYLSSADLSRWHTELAEMHQRGTFFFYGTMMLVSSRVQK